MPARLGPALATEQRTEGCDRYLDWASLLRRVCGEEILVCSRCGHQPMRVIAAIDDPPLAPPAALQIISDWIAKHATSSLRHHRRYPKARLGGSRSAEEGFLEALFPYAYDSDLYRTTQPSHSERGQHQQSQHDLVHVTRAERYACDHWSGVHCGVEPPPFE